MTYNFFLATITTAVLYCLCWILFLFSLPDKPLEKPEDVSQLLVISYFGKAIMAWATMFNAALTIASCVKYLL